MTKYIIKDLQSAFIYLPYGLIAGAAVMFVLNIINGRRAERSKKTYPVAAYSGLFMYLTIMLFITFLSRESGSRDGIDLTLGSTWGINDRNNAFVIENILLFIPLGFLWPWASRPERWPAIEKSSGRGGTFRRLRGSIAHIGAEFVASTMFGAAVSMGIECLQLITKRGYFQIDDILTNTLGMAIGCVFFLGISCLRRGIGLRGRE